MKLAYLGSLLAVYVFLNSFMYMNIGFSSDESNFLFTTKKMLEGHPPYKDYPTDIKMPGNYYFLSMFLAVGIDNLQFFRLLAFSINCVTAIFVYFLSSKIVGEKWGITSASIFLAVVSMPAMSGYIMSGDRLLAAFSAASVFFFHKGYENWKYFIYSGLFIGIAIVFKQLAVVIAISYFLFICYEFFMDKTNFWKRFARPFILNVVFSAIPFLLVLIHFTYMGAANEMLHWTTSEVNNLYKGSTWIDNPSKFTSIETLYNFSILSPILITAFFFTLYLVFKVQRKKSSRNEIFIFLLFLCTLYPFVIILRYFVLMVIPLSILATFGLIEIKKTFSKKVIKYSKTLVSCLIVLPLLLSVTLNVYSVYRLHSTYEDFYSQQMEVSDYISNITKDGDIIYVYGYVPSIYYYSGRDPPLGLYYIYPYKEHVNETEQKRTVEILKNSNVSVIALFTGQKSEENNPITYSFIVTEYNLNRTVGEFDIYTRDDI